MTGDTVSSYKPPAWVRQSADLCAVFFDAQTADELRQKAIAFDGESETEPGYPDPSGLFYLHHLSFLNLQAQADNHRLLTRIAEALEGMTEAVDELGEDAEAAARRLAALHRMARAAMSADEASATSSEAEEDAAEPEPSGTTSPRRPDVRATHIPSEHFAHPIPGGPDGRAED